MVLLRYCIVVASLWSVNQLPFIVDVAVLAIYAHRQVWSMREEILFSML